MNFIQFSNKKVLFIVSIAILMFVLIYATFSNKQAYYGYSPMTDIISWIASNTFYSTVYKVRAQNITNEATTLEIFKSNNLSGSNERTGNALALPVLVYHTVENGSETLNLERGAFEDQLFALKKAGWNTITLKEFQAFMRGHVTLPERSFLLTFDDGTKNSYHPVTPLLRVLDYTGVSFILPKHSIGTESHYYLSDYEIDTMLESGIWEIGSHGMDVHEYQPTDSKDTYEAPLVNYIWRENEGRLETREEYLERINTDLLSARDALEDRFNVTVSSFAYPFGEYGRPTDSNQHAVPGAVTVAERIYETSFYQWRRGGEFSFNYQQDESRSHLYKRIEPDTAWSGEELVQRLESGLPKTLPYESPRRDDEGWLRNWGKVSFTDTAITLKAEDFGTGATIFLDGSGHWENYTVTARIHSPTKTGFSLLARFKDDNNLAMCNFNREFVHIEQTISGKQRVIEGVRGAGPYVPQGTFEAQVVTNGRTISCVINGKVLVTSRFLDPLLSVGGVGIKTWNPEAGLASVVVEKFTVKRN
ncbi:MAG: hypothetical protein UV60_C0007G0029 [Parcubacteria group bacterium GW2011_GWA2_43_11]|nr:MAG: hypothetical protein UV60_C0007G0029 [Parcubacteria group bacterium GW2011_GWA2_43_11]